MLVLVLLAIFSAVESLSSSCPKKYSRFTTEHSFCLEPNPTCTVVHRGVDSEDRKAILKIHNEYRSKVALGNEEEAGGLPTASNMLQMEWDSELEAVAQKWASQCHFDHDCIECREVENFSVGQNLAYEDVQDCSSEKCLKTAVEPNWKGMIKLFYDEVKLFKKEFITNFNFQRQYGHFTQVAWADTWKVGCGYIVYKEGQWLRRLYACNYGPAGNAPSRNMYIPGKPCSDCPSNTCCGNCNGQQSEPGLCKVQNIRQGPVYESSRENTLVDCNWKKSEPTCNFKVDGKQSWKLNPSLSGNYYTITLKGGEKSSLKLMNPIQPKSSSFCILVLFRKTPLRGSGDLTVDMEMDTGSWKWNSTMTLRVNSIQFTPYSLSLAWDSKTEIELNFSVPPNAPQHIFDIKEVVAYEGKCDK